MHEKQAKSILSSVNGMNLYRGCTHGCIYCDSRSTCYQMQHEFEDVEIKTNAEELLEQALRKKRKKCMIGTGAMSDPYIPLEKERQMTRRCLEIIDEYGFGLSIQTKSDLILRDLELLKRIHRRTKCVVQMTLTTYDEDLCRILEPGVCTTKRRAEVLNIFREEGIPTVVWFTPMLPFINDTKENVRGILEYCIQAKVYGVLMFGAGLTLRDGNRQYFYRKLDESFPGMKEKYIASYGNSYEVMSPDSRQLMQLAGRILKENQIVTGMDRLFEYFHTFEEKPAAEQISLFDLPQFGGENPAD